MVAHLHKVEPVLHYGPNYGHEPFCFVDHGVGIGVVVQIERSGPALASAHSLRVHALHQRGGGIGADVGFHTEVPRVYLITRIHIGVFCLVVVFGGCGCCNRGGIAHKACPEQQAALAMNAVDNTKHLLGYVVILQSVAEPGDGEFIGQPGDVGEQYKLSVKGHIC